MPLRVLRALAAVALLLLNAWPAGAQGPAALVLDADALTYAQGADVITARGDVVATYAGYRLTADEVTYTRAPPGQVAARGNVVLTTPKGDVHRADAFTLSGDMREGVATALDSTLADGARAWADAGRRAGERITLSGATYTPCPVTCDADPTWQIDAAEVTQDQAAHTITYKNARLAFFGVPVLYTPYFAHPDGSVRQKSGLLTPSFGYASDLGVQATGQYYWAIAPDQDATIGTTIMTRKNPLALAQWRKAWHNAVLALDGSLTRDARESAPPGRGKNWRGHLFADGQWDITPQWRGGVEARLVTDDRFLARYDIDEDAEVLTNTLYAERLSGRDYAVIRAMDFRDLRVGSTVDQPSLLPEARARILGEAGGMPFLGGRWGMDASFLGLYRSGAEQDMRRASVTAEWVGRQITDVGLVADWRAAVRQDLYYVLDYAGSGQNTEYTRGRFFPQAHFQASYPLARPIGTSGTRATVAPVTALTLGGNVNEGAPIPNEDSQDVQLDATNLFAPSRFPGLDRVENGARATYGLRMGAHGASGAMATGFLGQSYRFSEDVGLFPAGSGLEHQASDVVGQVALRDPASGGVLPGAWEVDYRFQLDSRSMASQRQEVDLSAGFGPASVGTRYLFSRAVGGTGLTGSREQVEGWAHYQATPEWGLGTRALYDLVAKGGGLREADLGVTYTGACTSWSLTLERNLTNNLSGKNGTTVLFRFGLKNLGGLSGKG